MFSRAKSRALLLLAGVCLATPSHAAPVPGGASPTHRDEENLIQPLDYDYSSLKDVSEEVILEVSQKILVIQTDNFVLIDVEVEEVVAEEILSEVVEETLVSNSGEEKEEEEDEVAERGKAALTADQVGVHLVRLLEELARQGERVTTWRRSRGLEGGGTWHRASVRENGHGTLISKGW